MEALERVRRAIEGLKAGSRTAAGRGSLERILSLAELAVHYASECRYPEVLKAAELIGKEVEDWERSERPSFRRWRELRDAVDDLFLSISEEFGSRCGCLLRPLRAAAGAVG